jgi:glycosyltransferase involved in cell wall biosynthesis
MALGTPVVCAPVGALPEVVGDAGCWIDAHEPGAVAAAVGRVLTDRELGDRLSAAGRARAAEATDLDVLRDRVLEAYNRAAAAA